MIVAIISWMKAFPIPLIILFSLLSLIIVFSIVGFIMSSIRSRTTEHRPITRTKPEVYLTRTEMTANRGTFAEEFKDMKKIWAIWSTGQIIASGGNLKKIHIEKLILTSPKNEFLMKCQEPMCEDKDAGKIQKHITQQALMIENIADLAFNTSCEVKFYDGAIRDSIIIADKVNLTGDEFSDDAFVRIETGAPFIEYENRVNIVINKGKFKDAFEAFIEHYNVVDGRSKPYIKGANKTTESTLQSKTEIHSTCDKLMLVVKAIIEAKQTTPKGHDTNVVISDKNRLTSMYPTELLSVLIKLQNDEKMLKLKAFPRWLLPHYDEQLDDPEYDVLKAIGIVLDPQENKFIVSLEKKFDKWLSDFKSG